MEHRDARGRQSRSRREAGAGVIVTTERIQATHLGGSPRRKSSHRDLRPAERATGIHASDSLYAWAWYLRGGGGAAALAEDQGPAGLQATHGGGTGGGPGTTWRRRQWRTGTPRSGAGGGQGPADIKGARGSDRRRSGQSSDSESRSLRTAGLARPAGPRHSPAPTGVGRGASDCHGRVSRRQWGLRGAGSDGPPTKMCR
jgi:hypothetical protein